MTEEQVIQIINNIANSLASKFKFGYHELEDMRQQARLFAWEGIDNYDGIRPLENFLWTHIRNRLFNFKRDKYQSPDKPCLSCPHHRPNQQNFCGKYFHQSECKEYTSWCKRNDSKKNIMRPMVVDNLNELFKSNQVTDFLQNSEILNKIDHNLPVKYREHYLKMLHGDKVSKSDQRTVIEQISLILQINND